MCSHGVIIDCYACLITVKALICVLLLISWVYLLQDMDFVRFIMTCFKLYYPRMLGECLACDWSDCRCIVLYHECIALYRNCFVLHSDCIVLYHDCIVLYRECILSYCIVLHCNGSYCCQPSRAVSQLNCCIRATLQLAVYSLTAFNTLQYVDIQVAQFFFYIGWH